MKALFAISLISASVFMTGCQTTTMGAGSDTAAIAAARSAPQAQITDAEYRQYQRQRANVSEELSLEEQKRRNQQNSINGSLGTVNSIMSTINRAKWIF